MLPAADLLGWTLETIQLPYRSRIAARVEGKSSLARLGLGVHVTAPTIHAGFGASDADPSWPGNPIQLEIWNTGPKPILLKRGMKICQLIFEWVDGTPEQGYVGQFAVQGPTAPVPSPPVAAPPARSVAGGVESSLCRHGPPSLPLVRVHWCSHASEERDPKLP